MDLDVYKRMDKMKAGIRAGRRPILELTKIQPVYHMRRTPVDKDSVTSEHKNSTIITELT